MNIDKFEKLALERMMKDKKTCDIPNSCEPCIPMFTDSKCHDCLDDKESDGRPDKEL